MTTTIRIADLDTFTRQYIETALWSSTDDDGDALERDFQMHNIAPDTLAEMVAQCADFQSSFGDHIADDLSRAGHDFWLTRNGHGAGFWDGDWDAPYGNPEGYIVPLYSTVGEYLTAMSKPYGSYDLYVGDDGMVHGQ